MSVRYAKNRIGRKAFLVFLLVSLLVCIYRMKVLAEEGSCDVNIHSVDVKLPRMKAYVDIKYKDGKVLEEVKKENISIKINDKSLKVENLQTLKEAQEGTAYIFLIDTSLSFKSEDSAKIRKSIKKWVDKMNANDEAAIIAFGSAVEVAQNFTTDHYFIEKKVDELKPKDNKTRFYEGVMKAIELAEKKDTTLPNHKVILLLSDGQDDSDGTVTKEQVLNKLEECKVLIYTIGFWDEKINKKEKKNLKEILNEISLKSGGQYYEGDKETLEEIYVAVYQDIGNNHIIEVYAEEYKQDGSDYKVEIAFSSGNIKGRGEFTGFFPYEEQKVQEVGKAPEGNEKSLKEKTVEANSEEQNTQRADYLKEKYKIIFILMTFSIVIGSVYVIYKGHKNSNFNLKDKERDQEEKERIEYAILEKGIHQAPILKEEDPYNGLRTFNILDRDKNSFIDPIEVSIEVVGRGGRAYKFTIADGEGITIGKEVKCSIMIADNKMGEIHCELLYQYGIVTIQNFNSPTGIYVNSIEINTTRKLNNEDLFYVGNTLLKIKMVNQ